MTVKEARRYMLIEKECINRDCNRDCANCDIVQDVEDLNNAYDVAIQALEKQIPKQIDISKGESKKHYYCPVCYKWLIKMTNYCCKCGQKLYWSDEE